MAKPQKKSAKKVPAPKKVGKRASKSTEGKKDPATPEPPTDTFSQTPPPWASKEG